MAAASRSFSDWRSRPSSTLADSVDLSQSALSRLIGRLETDGFVSRSLCDSDRRGIFACLTPAGRDLVEQAVPTQAEVLAATLTR